MDSFLWVVFLLICVALATWVSRIVVNGNNTNQETQADPSVSKASATPISTFWMVWFVLFFSFFFCSQFLLGLLELYTGQPQVSAVSAIVSLLIVGSPAAVFCSSHFRTMAKAESAGLVSAGSARDLLWSRFPLETSLFVFVLGPLFCVTGMRVFGLPYGFETMAYVLPNALHQADTGSLMPWSYAATFVAAANQSVYNAMFLRLLPEGFVSIVNPVFVVPVLASIYAMSRFLGADNRAGILVAFGVLSVPLVGYHLFASFTDITGFAFISVAICLSFVRPALRINSLLIAGLAAGLAYGFKGLHVLPSVFLVIFIAMQEIFRRSEASRQDLGIRLVRSIGFYGLGVLLTSGFWLVRNYVLFDNPTYPFGVPVVSDLLGWPMPPESTLYGQSELQFKWVQSVAGWFVYPWVEWQYNDLGYTGRSGLGLFFAACLPASLIAATVVIFKGARASFASQDGRDKAEGTIWSWLLYFLAGAFIILAAWWVSDNRQPRYFVAALAFLFPLFGWMLTLLTGRTRLLADYCLALATVITFGLFVANQAINFVSHNVLIAGPERHHHYEYPRDLDSLPAGSKVINLASRSFNYILFGDGLDNQVVGYMDALRVLAPDLPATKRVSVFPEEVAGLNLCSPEALALEATHLYTYGNVTIADCEGVRLFEVDRLDTNLFNNEPLPTPRILFAIEYASK